MAKLNINGKTRDVQVTIRVVAPAVMNAIHAAPGKPVRSLPLKNLKPA